MSKLLKIAGIVTVLVAVIALVTVTGVFAQGPNDPDNIPGAGGMRRGNTSGEGLGVRAVEEADMHAAIANALGMTLEEFEAAVEAGETPYTLAETLDIEFAEIQAAMEAVHAEALQRAVDEGIITQERANWMSGRQAGRGGTLNGATPGSGMAQGRGNMAGGQGNGGGYGGECPYETP